MKIILRILSIVILLGIFGIITQYVSAEEINSFNSQIVSHKDGTMDITETIDYDFGDLSRHGIFRDIPKIAKVGDLFRVMEMEIKQVTRDGKPEKYQDNSDSNQLSLKIGYPDKTITGNHVYEISYLVRNGIGSNYDDHDEIYWNITGNQWQVPILQASAKLTTDFGVNPNRVICYTGPQGSTIKSCTFDVNYTITSNTGLGTSEGLTGVWGFPKNTFPPSILQKELPNSFNTVNNPIIIKVILIGIIAIPIFLNLILAPGLLIWYFKNKRKARFGPPNVNFDFPKDKFGKRVAPAEAGSIDIYQVDQNDVIATIFDLAIRKYLKIEQIKREKILGIFGEDEEYVFTKLKESDSEIQPFEQKLFDTLFQDGRNSVNLSDLKEDFYQTFKDFEKEVFQSLISKTFYNKNPKDQMGLLFIVGIVVIFMGGIILGLVLILLSRKLNGRTALGDEMDWKIDGLKIFLKNMSREHTWYAKNLITVEKYIPYAIALGYIKEFMDQLKVIYPNYKPSWYSGNLAFYSAITSMNSSMSSTFTTHASSSSSGFSGGGSSGGGGGGGGGGSW